MKKPEPTLPLPSENLSVASQQMSRLADRVRDAVQQAPSADTSSEKSPQDVLEKVKAQSPEERDIDDLAFLALSVEEMYSSDQSFCNECNLVFNATLDAWISQVKALPEDSNKELIEALFHKLLTLAPCNETQESEYEEALTTLREKLSGPSPC